MLSWLTWDWIGLELWVSRLFAGIEEDWAGLDWLLFGSAVLVCS